VAKNSNCCDKASLSSGIRRALEAVNFFALVGVVAFAVKLLMKEPRHGTRIPHHTTSPAARSSFLRLVRIKVHQ
jgi:hypothetical protein